MHKVARAFVLFAMLAARASGQTPSPVTIKADDTVRVSSVRVNGMFRVIAFDAEKLFLASPADTIITLATADLTRLAVSRGARPVAQGAIYGMTIGLLTGVAVGAAIGVFGASETGPGLTVTPGEGAFFGAMLFGALGGTLGLLYGTLNPGYIWVPVPLGPLRAGVIGSGQLAAGVSFRF